MKDNISDRRNFLIRTSLGLLGISVLTDASVFGKVQDAPQLPGQKLYYRYPAIHDDGSYGVVNAAHNDLDKVKELVSNRPELANASWDWGFGDYETAIGAASHTGRRDIAEYLISHGARPDIFTFAMMGMLKCVEEMVETMPGIQSHRGPHGITLLKHAQNRFNHKTIESDDKARVGKVIEYLEKLGDANLPAPAIPLSEEEKVIYMGEYKFGDGDTEVFTVGSSTFSPANINIVRKGLPGRLLFKIGENTFSPTGAPSVKIVFDVKEKRATSLSIQEHQFLVRANRI